MMFRIYILIFCLTFALVISVAQEKENPGTAVYVEVAGKGFISGNVDFPIAPKSRMTIGLTMLDHEFPRKANEQEYPTLTLPTPSFMYIHLFGQNRHYFEAGFGISVSPVFWKEYSENDSALSLHGVLGYRYQKSNKVFFRAGLTPFYRINWMFLPLAGVSIGYSW